MTDLESRLRTMDLRPPGDLQARAWQALPGPRRSAATAFGERCPRSLWRPFSPAMRRSLLRTLRPPALRAPAGMELARAADSSMTLTASIST